MSHTAPRITLLILAYSMVWSGTVTRTSSWCFHFHSHWSCCQRPIKNSVCQKNPPNHFVNKPMKYKCVRLTRHMRNLQWTNLYCPIQIYCSIFGTIYPGVLAISRCARDAVAEKTCQRRTAGAQISTRKRVIGWAWHGTEAGALSPMYENTDVV